MAPEKPSRRPLKEFFTGEHATWQSRVNALLGFVVIGASMAVAWMATWAWFALLYHLAAWSIDIINQLFGA